MKLRGPNGPRSTPTSSGTTASGTTASGSDVHARIEADGNDTMSDEPTDPTRAKHGSRSQEAARRTLQKLGAKMSLRPAPEVPIEERTGKTGALHGVRTATARARPGTYAAIDLGSSSAKMLVLRLAADGSSKVLLDLKIGSALGKGVVPGEDIPKENQQRALDALQTFIDEADRIGGIDAKDIPMITTAVVRNSRNGAQLLDAVKALGLTRARTLSGDEEAAMGFAGALAMTKGVSAERSAAAPGRYATLDLGGGSFQLAVGTEQGMSAGGSTQLGSNIILDEMLAPHASPTGVGTSAHLDAVDAALLTKAPMPLGVDELRGRTLVATGGVSKFLRAHFGKDVISREEIDTLRHELIALPYAERAEIVVGTKDDVTKKALGVDTPEGALDYGKKLPASASLLLHILESIGVDEVRVSETDSRHALVQVRAAEPR